MALLRLIGASLALLGVLRAHPRGRHTGARPARPGPDPDRTGAAVAVLLEISHRQQRPRVQSPRHAAPAPDEPLLIRPYYVEHERRQHRAAHPVPHVEPPPVELLRRTLSGLHAMGAEGVAA